MGSDNVLDQIINSGVVAIMRAKSSDQLLAAAEAILGGGVNTIEVTMTTPGAIDVIKQATTKFGSEVIFGVGSVLDAETARIAILAGAKFVVGPTVDVEMIKLCKRYSIPVIPGAFTPSEVIHAWQSGADLVKIFPASFGGPAYLKAIKAPLPQVKLVPVGGVTVENTADFIRAGAEIVAIGSALINQALLDSGDLDEMTTRARRFRKEVERGRSV
jgi:2-dehydro-3-deoxyphosphogluconate aldolase/(4S)-4-hydroxy-2-oxoglutarate aldolase